jgi:hypothetical protein
VAVNNVSHLAFFQKGQLQEQFLHRLLKHLSTRTVIQFLIYKTKTILTIINRKSSVLQLPLILSALRAPRRPKFSGGGATLLPLDLQEVSLRLPFDLPSKGERTTSYATAVRITRKRWIDNTHEDGTSHQWLIPRCWWLIEKCCDKWLFLYYVGNTE